MGNSGGQVVDDHKDQQSEANGDFEEELGGLDGDKLQTMSVFQGDAASQELIIENLENLDDAAALIVTREGDQFKIGIQ